MTLAIPPQDKQEVAEEIDVALSKMDDAIQEIRRQNGSGPFHKKPPTKKMCSLAKAYLRRIADEADSD